LHHSIDRWLMLLLLPAARIHVPLTPLHFYIFSGEQALYAESEHVATAKVSVTSEQSYIPGDDIATRHCIRHRTTILAVLFSCFRLLQSAAFLSGQVSPPIPTTTLRSLASRSQARVAPGVKCTPVYAPIFAAVLSSVFILSSPNPS
jgi:hypothetical protein